MRKSKVDYIWHIVEDVWFGGGGYHDMACPKVENMENGKSRATTNCV